ncbi:histidine kinase dimerization/phospho-acceptor domain-containing protein [Sphingomonas sp. MMS24-J45]|uniref:histidine kinase dimerization/phospho-acceptor domain-containing protein n=1 Tax=Sphingomonas sp. MMS24-J45 TaxID=3238806 RepID=UPI003850EFE9
MSSPFGVQSAWRQLVDLIGRGRAAASDAAMARLRAIRGEVPPPVRAASARALAFATPPVELVAIFAEDEIGIAAPVLRSAQLSTNAWLALLPRLTPAARSILRHRRDLSPEVGRALETFGSVDFVLGAPKAPIAAVSAPETAAQAVAEPESVPDAPPAAEPTPDIVVPETIAPVSPFLSIAAVAAGLPVVAEALRQAERPVAPPPPAEVTSARTDGTFQIAELVARIDAYQRQREAAPTPTTPPEFQPELFAREPYQAEAFRFETDSDGIVRWVEGAARAPLIGLSLDLAADPGGSRVDGVAAGAFRRRAGFANARLLVEGQSDAAGQWRITGVPVFDRASGRFTGYRGTARRPRADESAEPTRETRNPAADALRQLVHELRTPTNAIAGFAEMIESQMLGPVPAPYRAHAAAIRMQTSGLLAAIDDIDMAARIETHALDLRTGDVPVSPLLDRVIADLTPLATLRGASLQRWISDDALAILGDDRAVERLIARLLATLVASGGAGERIGVVASGDDGIVTLVFDRPAALAAYAEEALLTIDAEAEAERADEQGGAPLLGTGFALRLARNLAAELRGSLTIGDKALTLRLPAAFSAAMEQASSN